MIRSFFILIIVSGYCGANTLSSIASAVLLNPSGKYDSTTKRVSGEVRIIRSEIDYPLKMKRIILTDGKQLFETSLNLQGEFLFLEKLRQGEYELIVESEDCTAKKKVIITSESKFDNIRLTCRVDE